ncbi:hypothetical protein AMECASPLE_017614 [Ameca splendens]|uniref:Uncharacterized protein n=2 Tax=Goodeidae TaxID=28758 RepID=A0ABU7BNE1_9TELE|nr:hypothetical protein [Ataeniobius toweri]
MPDSMDIATRGCHICYTYPPLQNLLSPDVTSDYKHHHYHHPPAKDSEIDGNSHSHRLTGAIWVIALPCLHVILDL